MTASTSFMNDGASARHTVYNAVPLARLTQCVTRWPRAEVRQLLYAVYQLLKSLRTPTGNSSDEGTRFGDPYRLMR